MTPKKEQKEVIMAKEIPNDISTDSLSGGSNGIYFLTPEIEAVCTELETFKCIVSNCKDKNKSFSSMILLKKHLKTSHNRVFCDICIKHNTAVLSEQKLFRPSDLRLHLKKGELDKEGNLVMTHPYCCFCKQHFFNDEDFAKHLRSKHYKCDLCHKDHKNVIYNTYENLQKHFQASHYACRRQECIEKCFVVFKIAEELENHIYKIHQEDRRIREREDIDLPTGSSGPNKIIDREGMDMSSQFLVIKRKRRTQATTDEDFDHKFDIREFLEIKREVAAPQKKKRKQGMRGRGKQRGGRGGRGGRNNRGRKGNQKKNNRFEALEDSSEEDQYEQAGSGRRGGRRSSPEPEAFEEGDLHVEDLILPKLTSIPAIDFEEFRENCLDIISPNQFEGLNKKITAYLRHRCYAQDLFEEFVYNFGNQNSFKLFSQFVKTQDNFKTISDLDEELDHQVARLKPGRKCLVTHNKTYSDLFKKITRVLAENTQARFGADLITSKNPYKKDKSIIFQFIGCIRAMNFSDLLKFKYLSNFCEDENTVETIQKSLFVKKDKVNDKLSTIPNIDIILSFLYFSLATSRFEGKIIVNTLSKINPNLNKLFLRHFPSFAKEKSLPILSDEEDYNIPNRQSKKKKGNKDLSPLDDHLRAADRLRLKQTFRAFGNKNYGQVTDVFASKKEDVTSYNIHEEDLTNQYDFPEIQGENEPRAFGVPIQQKNTHMTLEDRKFKLKSGGWGKSDMYVYNTVKMSKSEMNDLFPSLDDDATPPLPQPVKKQAPKKAQPPPVNQKKKLVKKDRGSGWDPLPSQTAPQMNWLQMAQQQTNSKASDNSGLTILTKKKKKKKRYRQLKECQVNSNHGFEEDNSPLRY